jgi:hypothetical protein
VNPTRWDDSAADNCLPARASAPLTRGVLWRDSSARFLNLMRQSGGRAKRRRGNSRQHAATSGHPGARRGEKSPREQRRLYDFTASRLDQSMKSDSAMRRRQRMASTKWQVFANYN